MGLAAVAAHKLGGVIPVGAIFRGSIRIGNAWAGNPPVAPDSAAAESPLRILQG